MNSLDIPRRLLPGLPGRPVPSLDELVELREREMFWHIMQEGILYVLGRQGNSAERGAFIDELVGTYDFAQRDVEVVLSGLLESGTVEEQNNRLLFRRWPLLHGDVAFRVVGIAHVIFNYLTNEGVKSVSGIKCFFIEDYYEGGSDAVELERDVNVALGLLAEHNLIIREEGRVRLANRDPW